MPIFAPEEKVLQVIRMEKVESGFNNGYQIEMELSDPNPETGNPRNWLGIPESGRVTKRTVLGWWLDCASEVEKKIDGLDFRTVGKTKIALASLCKWMTGSWYLWESREPPGTGYTQKAKERWVPTRRFADEAAALAYYSENIKRVDLSDDEDDGPPLGVAQNVVNAAMPLYMSAGKDEAIIRTLAGTQWPGVDVDELITALKAQAQ